MEKRISLRRMGRLRLGALALVAMWSLTGCGGSKSSIVLYSDQSKTLVDPLVKQFTKESGIAVDVVYATPEELKTGQGLSTRILEERDAPKADLYWACDPSAAEDLAEDKIFDKIKWEIAQNFDQAFRGESWLGLGGWGRVLLFNKTLVPAGSVPTSLLSLTDPHWKGRCAMADPRLSGSARYHIALMYALMREEDGKNALQQMKENEVLFTPTEQEAVDAVVSGKVAWAIVNSDLAEAAMRAKKPVTYIVPDQGINSTSHAFDKTRDDIPTLGTLLLSAPLAKIHSNNMYADTNKLIDFLTSAQIALKMADLAPTRLPTHVALERAPDKKNPHALDPEKARIEIKKYDQLRSVQSQVALALSKVLGDLPAK